MSPERFIAGRMRFKGRMAALATGISAFVMIVAVTVSAGFRKEIRDGLASMTGDVILAEGQMSLMNEGEPVYADSSLLDLIRSVEGVKSVKPAVFRAGIARNGNDIQGVLVKGVPGRDSSMHVDIPSRLAEKLRLSEGDNMVTYFVGEKTKVRKFRTDSIYESLVTNDEDLIVLAPIEDLVRLNGWKDGEVSALEVILDDSHKSRRAMKEKAEELGLLTSLAATSASDKYSQLFDWLDLIDFNVVAILILMTVVAGFNMISGLYILLFRNISTIGLLKSLGMTDKSIGGVFLRISARIVALGIAAGNAVALLFCLVQGSTHVIRLNPENYFLSYVPVHINLPAIIAADVISFAAIMLLMLVTTSFISKVDPSETVKAD